MNFIGITSWRANLIETFETLRTQAVLASLIGKVFGKNTKLVTTQPNLGSNGNLV